MTLKLPEEGDPLTFRELQVIALVAQGLSAKEIAKHLGLSPRTVEIFRQNAVVKLGARNMTHAATIAVRDGIVDIDAVVSTEMPTLITIEKVRLIPGVGRSS